MMKNKKNKSKAVKLSKEEMDQVLGAQGGGNEQLPSGVINAVAIGNLKSVSEQPAGGLQNKDNT